MANSFKTNLSSSATEYSRYYGGFRGVDFSNDHTQVNQSRLAYLVNMYKDYKSGQGEALETIAGYRRRADFSKSVAVNSNGVATATEETANKEIYGIFNFKCKVGGNVIERVVVHSGKKLYLWHNYPYSINVKATTSITAPEATGSTTVGETTINEFSLVLPFDCEAIINLKTQSGDSIITGARYQKSTKTLIFTSSDVRKNDVLELEYYEGVLGSADILFSTMNERKSESFICNNLLYLIDGKNFLVYDGTTLKNVKSVAYVPTTYKDIVPDTDNADTGWYNEQRNFLTPKFKHTFVATGTATEFCMNENALDSIVSVKVYGVETTDYTADLANGKITFNTAPQKPEETETEDGGVYPQGYAGIEITASKVWKSIDGVKQETDIADIITGCTLCTTYDNRVFFSGNPDYHNLLFWCKLSNVSGRADPTYWGVQDFQPDGVGHAPITGLMCVSDTLMVLKADTQQDSAIYFHAGQNTNDNVQPRIYPSVQGLSGLGCVGACCNFLDDPIFISRLGVEGVSQLKIASERANEHRSRLIDAKLVNTDLSKVSLEEWGGYLCVLTDGKIFLADSRQRYQDTSGSMEYEWYYLENIGVWRNQYKEFSYSSVLPEELIGAKVEHDGVEYAIELANQVYYPQEYETKNLCGNIVNAPDDEGNSTANVHTKIITVNIGDTPISVAVSYTVYDITDSITNEIIERHIYLCESKGNHTGGVFQKAVVLRSMSDNLFFGCVNGTVCSFNFDQRDEDGELPPSTYNFDERTIMCGCATLMDNCQIPHLTKTTIKRSTVIKTKSFKSSTAKVKVRTNKKPYEQISRINSASFSFDDVDFSDFSFITNEQSLFAVKEKEKQWVEKQYYIYSDEYLKPFALYYISFRYRVAGRYKD